jgi:hypothetical protein
MGKRTLAAVAAFFAMAGAAFAASENWLVTEENIAGVKGSQGTWVVSIEGSRITGSADMQAGNGGQLTYKLEGSVADGVYTVNLIDRTDGKKGCVWSGHIPAASSTQTKGLIGYAECEGSKLILRASMFGR